MESFLSLNGNNQKLDSNYKRNVTCSIFIFFEQLRWKRYVSSNDYIAAIKRVINIKYLSDLVFPDVKKIILVIDNINTHKPASIYKVFKPKETQRIIKRLQIHYNPKHWSLLNMGEIKLKVMTH